MNVLFFKWWNFCHVQIECVRYFVQIYYSKLKHQRFLHYSSCRGYITFQGLPATIEVNASYLPYFAELNLYLWFAYRRGPVKYKFQTLYELDSLAVVNARDVGPCKNAFKILMFPDTRMFQADNPKTKVKFTWKRNQKIWGPGGWVKDA